MGIKKLSGESRVKQLEYALKIALSYMGKAINDSDSLNGCAISGEVMLKNLTSILLQEELK